MFEKYSPMQLRNAIEIELQKTDDAKTAAIIAMKRLNKDPEYYEDMTKAKYIRKDPDGKGGFNYIYKEKKQEKKKEKPTNQTDTKEFKAWFGDSKVVDKAGKPLVVYHGTTKVFKEFSKKEIGEHTDTGMWGEGFYFGSDPEYASKYAKEKGSVLPVYISLKNPYIIKSKDDIPQIDIPEETMEDLINADKNYSKEFNIIMKEEGHDGVIIQLRDNYIEYIAFEPEQIKSATGNIGTFDPNNPDMTKAKDTSKLTKKVITNKLGNKFYRRVG